MLAMDRPAPGGIATIGGICTIEFEDICVMELADTCIIELAGMSPTVFWGMFKFGPVGM